MSLRRTATASLLRQLGRWQQENSRAPVYRQLTIDPWLPPREALAAKGIKIENSDDIIHLLSVNDFKYGLRFTINPELAEG